jgi:hypothetical protein
MLDQLSQWEKEKTSRQAMLNALMASGKFDASTIFPEHFGPGPEEVNASAQAAADAYVDDPEAAIDFSEVVWTPTTEEAYLEMVRLMEEAAGEDEDDETLPMVGEPQQDGEWV